MHVMPAAHSKASNPSRLPGGAPISTNPTLAEAARLASLRRSTPDSEAILSSDDEHDLTKSIQSLTGRTNKSSEGGSWLNEIQSGPPRRASTTTSASNMSQPTTPFDQVNDPSATFFQNPLSRVVSNPVTTSWNSASPWTQAQSRMYMDERPNLATARDASPGYSVPVQPTPKTHRSQSYSVGQMESDMANANAAQGSSWDRQRLTPSQQMLHRPSRPSTLSEVFEGPNPSFSLGPPDRDSYGIRRATSPNKSPDGRRESLVESTTNPLLRHATKARARHGQSASISETRSSSGYPPGYPFSAGSATEQAIDEEYGGDEYGANALTRRFSELTGLGGPADEGRRGQWHSSLGFGMLPDIPQSRRHSMADMPTRRNSSAGGAGDAGIDNLSMEGSQHSSAVQDDQQRDMQNRNYAVSYFSGVAPALRSRIESTHSPMPSSGPHAMQYQHQGSHGIFSRPSQDTPLYLISFKCARAEVYYVADNTGLEVKEGDLVIVEADRGHDLGTVLNVRLDWAQARELKAKANDEHYRWLMMFSRHNQTSEGITPGGTGGMMAGNAPDRSPTAATHGYGSFNPPIADTIHREAELKPKMIKRLAQPHEIATLRDKEGNEAKAKRICQQKVNEMKLDMEILDAEFQTDWKKLTFFYYAHSYVNFNALVTDLFKVYKTRIWMSAVNPASLNTAPVPPPRGLGPGAVSGRENTTGHRGTGSRNFSGGFGQEQYGGLPMYQHPGMGDSYDYNADQSGGGQQGYDMMPPFGNAQAGYNPPMHNFGWGPSGGGGGFGGGLYPMNPTGFGGPGPGLHGMRGGPGPERGDFNPQGRMQQSVSPISPPGVGHAMGRGRGA